MEVNKFYLKINLSFFQEGSAGEKTEEATARKKKKARDEGQVAMSQEISTAFLFIAVFFALGVFSPYIVRTMGRVFNYAFTMTGDMNDAFTFEFIRRYITHMFLQILLIAAPILLVSLVIGVLTSIAQVGWNPTTKPLQAKLNKMDPIKGFKRIFSKKSLVEFVKSLFKMAVIVIVLNSVIRNNIHRVFHLVEMELDRKSVV